ncbi:MAG TPA: hypothetical protein VI318_09955 [Baekduia sp.]
MGSWVAGNFIVLGVLLVICIAFWAPIGIAAALVGLAANVPFAVNRWQRAHGRR